MSANPKQPRATEWVEYEYGPHVSLAEVLALLENEKRTGELRINVNEGGVRSMVWKTKKRFLLSAVS
jgi:hypothetical protein